MEVVQIEARVHRGCMNRHAYAYSIVMTKSQPDDYSVASTKCLNEIEGPIQATPGQSLGSGAEVLSGQNFELLQLQLISSSDL